MDQFYSQYEEALKKGLALHHNWSPSKRKSIRDAN